MLEKDEAPLPDEGDAPPEPEYISEAELNDLRIAMGSDPDEAIVHQHRLLVADECRLRLQEISPDRLCAETLEAVVMFAYDAGRQYLLRCGLPEEDEDLVPMVETDRG